MHLPLPSALAEHVTWRERLKEEFPEIDEETLHDTLEGISSLPECLAVLVRSYLEDATIAEALRSRVRGMQERLARLETRADRKKDLALEVMTRGELKKLLQPDFTLTLRPAPSELLITDEASIPNEFWKPQPAKLDRQGLRQQLRSGTCVPGAILRSGGFVLAVRRT
jgi:hypothetical protein